MISALKTGEDMTRWPTFPWVFWAFSSSLALHGVAYASLGLSPRSAHTRPAPSEVTFEVNPLPEPPPPPPEPPPAPEPPAPEAHTPPPQQARPTRPAPAPTIAKSDPPPAAPLDLSGVTLTNAGDSAFSMPVGNGQAFNGAIGPGGPRAIARAEPAPSAAPARGPEIVPLSDLSSRPVPPALDGALRQNYPEEARRRAVGGTASVRARLDPDGILRRVQVQNETFPGFGNACRRTLEGSRWSAPRDRAGRAVATEIRYTCRFQVDP
jgi:periplasmic protein TonB